MLWFIDNEIVSQEEARISPNDIGILRGMSAFEYIRTYNRNLFCLEDHIDRLEQSCALLDMDLPVSKDEVRSIVHRLNDAFGEENAGIQLVVTGGFSSDQFRYEGLSRIFGIIRPCPPITSSGFICETVQFNRGLALAKTANYVVGIKEMGRRKVDEVLYRDADGGIFEGVRSNFFAVKNGVLITAPGGILEGVTRKVVLDLYQGKVELRLPNLNEGFDEAFITSTTKEVMPVLKIDGELVGNGLVGSFTKSIQQLFLKKVGALKSTPEAVLG